MGKSVYIIKTAGLPAGEHEFQFSLNEAFFKERDIEEINKAHLLVKVVLFKQNNVLSMHVEINGSIKQPCDKCLKDFDLPLSVTEQILVKQGNPEASEDGIIYITEGETDVDISAQIFEFVLTSVPARKVPCELVEGFACDEQVLSKLKQYEIKEQTEANPMWEQLNKIKLN